MQRKVIEHFNKKVGAPPLTIKNPKSKAAKVNAIIAVKSIKFNFLFIRLKYYLKTFLTDPSL